MKGVRLGEGMVEISSRPGSTTVPYVGEAIRHEGAVAPRNPIPAETV